MSKKNQLRIISGQWRGRKLNIADIPGLRPTGDRIRETLFNWLMPYISDSHCLDLFAGSGALGLESLSRGARSATLVEKNKQAARQLEQHVKTLNAEGADIINHDTLLWLASNTLPKCSFNIVFIDPPFAEKLWHKTIAQLDQCGLLAADSLIYIESPKQEILNMDVNWTLLKEKISGDVSYRLYRCDSLNSQQ